MSKQPNDASTLTAFGIKPERFAEVAEAFAEISKEIEALRALDLDEMQPAVVFKPHAFKKEP